jgi:hypothetical protein
MSDDDVLRAALRRRLEDPKFRARIERRYDEIIGEPGVAGLITPAVGRDYGSEFVEYPRIRVAAPSSQHIAAMPGEPETIEAIWNGNWQRSVGIYTLTRFDSSINLDGSDGTQVVYTRTKSQGRFTWKTEHYENGRKTETRRYEYSYDTAEEALFEMHRAAHQELDRYVL